MPDGASRSNAEKQLISFLQGRIIAAFKTTRLPDCRLKPRGAAAFPRPPLTALYLHLQFSEVHQMTPKTFLIAALLSTIAACSGGGYGTTGPGNPPPPPPPPTPGTVVATNSLVFTPSTLHVNAGDQVTFSFGSVAHNVFFDAANGAPTNIEGLNANTTVQRTFPTAGTYTYNCHIHPGMSGTVVVN
jgi:plastocyanin